MEYHSCEFGPMLPTLRTMAPYRHESMSDIDGWERMTPIEVLLYYEIEKLEGHTTAELLEMCRFERVRVKLRFGVGQRRKFLLALATARLRRKLEWRWNKAHLPYDILDEDDFNVWFDYGDL